MNGDSMKTSEISRPVEVLRGTGNIAERFGVKSEAIREMERQGAPIYRYGASQVRICDVAELWTWWKGAMRH